MARWRIPCSETRARGLDRPDRQPPAQLHRSEQSGALAILAGERDRAHVLKIVRQCIKPGQRIFVGVVAPIDSHIETPEVVRDRIREAARFIPLDQLGTTDDCGFSPFSDDLSTTRDTAFAKIRAPVLGTELASQMLGA